MSKKNKQKKANSSFTEQFKTGGNEVIEGLGFDPNQDALKTVDEKRKEEPTTRIFGELQDQIIEDRKEMLKKGLFEEYDSLKDKLQGIKPDIEGTVDEDGNEVKPRYTRKAFNEKESLKKKFDSLKKALKSAYVDADYKALEEYFNNK